MSELRVILDKSVVQGLNNFEIDSLDRYFHLIVPPILTNEILAGLAKEADDPKAVNQIAAQSYRISGNRGIPVKYEIILELSIRGDEIPMDGRYLPDGDSYVRSEKGTIGRNIDTTYLDEIVLRWERKEFKKDEAIWAINWRRLKEKPLNPRAVFKSVYL